MGIGIQSTADEYSGRNGFLNPADVTKSKDALCAELAVLRRRVAELEQSNNGYYGTRRVLHKAVQRYRETIDYAALGFFQSTPAGRYLSANLTCARLLGYESPMELMDSVADIQRQIYVDPSDRDRLQQLLNTNGSVENFEYLARRKDGSTLWLCVSARIVKDAGNGTAYYEGSILDVTHYKTTIEALTQQLNERTDALRESNDYVIAEVAGRQRVENALNTTQHQFDAILETIPGIVSWISSDLRYLGVNRQLADMFGRQPEEFVNQDIGFLNTGPTFKNFIQDFFQSPADEGVHEFYATVKGERRHYLIVVQKYVVECDRQAAFAVGIDVTAKEQAEQDLRLAKDKLQAALDAVPGIVSWISSDLKYLGVNRHLANLFNLPIEAFIGKDIGFLHTSPDFVAFVQDIFNNPTADASREISAIVNGEQRDFLIMAQKYSQQNAVFSVGIDITQRKQAEKNLQEAESKYRSIFNSVADGIFQSSPKGYYISANPALARIYGYDSVEDLKKNLTSIRKQLYVEPNRRDEFVRRIEQEGEILCFESQVYRKDGHLIWISENARAIRDEDGRITCYEGTVKDITERKHAVAALEQAKNELTTKVEERTRGLQVLNQRLVQEVAEREEVEKALRTSEAELRALFSAMTDYIAVFDAHGRYQKILDTSSDLLYNPDLERTGKSVYEVLPPEQATLFMITIQRALNSNQTITLDYTLPIQSLISQPERNEQSTSSVKGATNQEAWFSATISPLPGNRVIWVARDITQQKMAETVLRETEAKYRGIVENATDGIFQTTPDGYCISANPALLRMYGYESLREFMEEVGDVSKLYVEAGHRKQFVKLLEHNGVLAQFESQIKRRNGEIIWISENARVVKDETGKINHYEGIVQDITVRKQAELALQAEQKKSEELLLNILPEVIAKELKHRPGEMIADRFEQVTVLFADIVNFTSLSASIPPNDLVKQLNQIFSLFDHLADCHGLEKIKTIGDAYMVVGGLPTPMDDHAVAIADMALKMQAQIGQFKRNDGKPFQLRIGIHTGPVVAGVIGIRKFIYDLWGDTVNVASRLEAKGASGGIQVTTDVYRLLKHDYHLEKRGTIDVKGKGEMTTYWLKGAKTSK